MYRELVDHQEFMMDLRDKILLERTSEIMKDSLENYRRNIQYINGDILNLQRESGDYVCNTSQDE
jgi:hypothetical protein